MGFQHHLILLCLVSLFAKVSIAGDCRKTNAEKDYKGKVSKTRGGLECQRWDTKVPHKHIFSNKSHPDAGLDENYCRNPDGEPDGPWCYTTSKQKRWDYCYIPLCQPDKCKKTVVGKEYRGIVSKTRNGVVCQRWDSQEPHQHGITPDTHRDSGLDENFCRNPDGEPGGPWCYTTSAGERWDYCSIPMCDPCSNIRCGLYSKCVVLGDGNAKCVCRKACPLIYKPVCGSDGKTYPNKCVLEFQACEKGVTVDVVKNGKCENDDPCSNIRCGLYSKCVVLDDGNAKCVCKKACPLIYKPVCGSDGKTYPNKCVLEFQACEKGVTVDVVKNGKCENDDTGVADGIMRPTVIKGNIKLDKEVSIDSKSCLVITLREAIYCAKFEDCPDNTIATNVIRDLVVSPDNWIPYNLTVTSKLKPNRYLVEATLNRGWCHVDDEDNKKWLRDGDLFNSIEHAVEIDTAGYYTEDIAVIAFTQKESKSGDDPCDDMKCEFYSYCKVTEDGKPTCQCNLGCPLIYKPVCGSDGKEYANKCVMEYEACISRKMISVSNKGKCQEKKTAIAGDIRKQTTTIFGRAVLVSEGSSSIISLKDLHPDIGHKSCLVITLREAIYCTTFEDCPDTTVATHVIRNITVSPDKWIPYNIVVTSKLKPNRYLIEGTLNRGWCYIDQKDGNKWIRGGDFFNDVEHSIEIERAGKYEKDISIRYFHEKKLKLENKHDGKDNKSECEKERQSVFDSFPVIHGEKRPLVGAFVPQCNEDGSYKKVQCHGSTGYCWCVDESGTKLEETAVRFKQPDCEKGKDSKSECEKERQSVFDSFPIIQGKKRPLLGAFVPQCNEDGSYKKVQCHGSTGYCWCVDESGTKMEETAVRFKQPDCEKGKDNKSECEKERQSVFDSFPVIQGERRPLLGAFIPQCNEDGSYKKVQCHGSTGYCWCVDESGTKKKETEVRFKQPDCEKGSKSKCEKHRQRVFDTFPVINGKKQPMPGAFTPQCNEDGSYKKVQCHGSTGYCWCVDENGKKKEGTQLRFKQPAC